MIQRNVLVVSELAAEGIELLEQSGCRVDVVPDLAAAELANIIAPYDALIVHSSTEVTRAVIDAAPRLKIIGRAGVSVDSVDIDAASDHGVIVCNAPTSNVVSAAELTMGLLLACARNLPQANASMHAGKWERLSFAGVELYEKTLAIFGLGRVGGLVAERARAFGMNLVGYDPYCSRERADQLGVTLYDTVEEILPLADFITVHLPKTKETIGMFGPRQYAIMKDGVVLVNVARGGIYDIDSLADFVAAEKIGAVAIDRFDAEPCATSPLHEFDNVILTPHLGSSTCEARVRAGVQIAEYVLAGLAGSVVPTALNGAPVPPEFLDVVGPYVPACQMMGRMLAQIIGDVPKSVKITTTGAMADADVDLLFAGALGGFLSNRQKRTVTSVNASAIASRYGIKVESASVRDSHEFASTVSILADGREVSATLSGGAQKPRIVSLLGYKMDMAPAKSSLIFEYADGPGRIGTIGTILGNAGVNITTMQIGTDEERHCALVYMNVEGEVDEAVMAELHAAIDLKNLWFISL